MGISSTVTPDPNRRSLRTAQKLTSDPPITSDDSRGWRFSGIEINSHIQKAWLMFFTSSALLETS